MDEVFLNYGIAGAMLIVLLAFAKQTIDRLVKDRDRAEEQRDALVREVLGSVTPALERSIEAVKARDGHDDEVRDVLIDVRRWLENHGNQT